MDTARSATESSELGQIRLTPAGIQALEAQRDAEERNEDRILSALTERELRTLAGLLRKLMLAAER